MQITILLVIYTILLAVFGIKNAFIIAFLCALLNLIPYIGPIFGGVLMIILTLTNDFDLNFSAEILPNVLTLQLASPLGNWLIISLVSLLFFLVLGQITPSGNLFLLYWLVGRCLELLE